MTTSTPAIGVTALGMVSALGLDAHASCAAARAGLCASAELDVLSFAHDSNFGDEDDESPAAVFGHAVPGLAAGFAGMGKALALAGPALADLLARRPLGERDLLRTAIYLNVTDRAVEDAYHASQPPAPPDDDDDDEDEGGPAPREAPSAAWRGATAALLPRILQGAGMPIPEAHQHLILGGRAGVARAVGEAVAALQRGSVERCIVGGVDSRIEPAFLRAAAYLGLLRTNQNPVGLAPGEAASFLLLERADEAARRGIAMRALVTGASLFREQGGFLDEAQPTGRGLAQAIAAAIAGLGAPPALFVADLDGTERRAFDWGHALHRLRAEHGLDGVPAWLPVMSFGDTGAAAGAVAVSLAVRAFERGYGPGDAAVVWLASESGDRGAIGLRAEPRRG